MARETVEQEIRRLCDEAGCNEYADEFIEAERTLGWVRNWLKANADRKPSIAEVRASLKDVPRRPKPLDPEAIYRRFNNPPKRA